MTGMVEKVARAICEDDHNVWEDASVDMREAYLSNARRSLEAIRYPSKSMEYAALPFVTRMHQGRDIYFAMITAALNEKEQA